MRVLVKEGWADRETGKKVEPRLQFALVQYLQDVLSMYAKKLIINLDIKTLDKNIIEDLKLIFNANKGDNQVAFEVSETEKIIKQITPTNVETDIMEPIIDENGDILESENQEITSAEIVEETRKITSLTMPSRKLKVKISNELLTELEKRQVDFRLN
jgi:DNA polymerase-3 subunit alpha